MNVKITKKELETITVWDLSDYSDSYVFDFEIENGTLVHRNDSEILTFELGSVYEIDINEHFSKDDLGLSQSMIEIMNQSYSICEYLGYDENSLKHIQDELISNWIEN